MIDKIKELRVQIDGLTQLVQGLKPPHKYLIDVAYIPTSRGFDLEQWIKIFESTPYAFIASDETRINNNKPVQIITENKYTDRATQNLELSKMWLGKVLKELGNSNPYPESKNPGSDKIEPTADVADLSDYYVNPPSYEHLTHIQKVKWLRAEIEKVEIQLKKLLEIGVQYPKYFWYGEHLKDSTKNCMEAGMWLGMELGRIRDSEIK